MITRNDITNLIYRAVSDNKRLLIGTPVLLEIKSGFMTGSFPVWSDWQKFLEDNFVSEDGGITSDNPELVAAEYCRPQSDYINNFVTEVGDEIVCVDAEDIEITYSFTWISDNAVTVKFPANCISVRIYVTANFKKVN
jgi:hypothetical protein